MKTLMTAGLLALVTPMAAAAQSVPLTVQFDGVVSGNPAEGIRIRTYDPASGYQYEPFAGNVPDYAYHAGDKVTFSFQTFVPSAPELASGRYNGARQPDGTYRIDLVGVNNAGSQSGVGVVRDIEVTGPIRTTLNAGQPLGGRGLSIYIDPADNSYSLGTDSGWLFSTFDAPGYAYDPIAGTLSPTATTCAAPGACAATGDGGFAFKSDNLSSIQTSSIPIYGTDGGLRGAFSMMFGGMWNLPAYVPGSAVKVPEPPMILLFGAAAAAMMLSRRRFGPQQTRNFDAKSN